MVDERSSLTKVIKKTKEVFHGTKYGSTNDRKDTDTIATKQNYQKLKFFRKLWKRKSAKKTEKELSEEGISTEQKNVTLITYAFCFIMMMAGLSVKMN